MRTKTLLLTAAIVAAGIGASQAQVYSVNAVGYVNVSVTNGYNLIANPLNGTNNNINTVIPAAPDQSLVFYWNTNTQNFLPAVTFFDFGAGNVDTGWYDGDNKSALTLNPGNAFYFRKSTPGLGTLTFVGDVPQGANLAVGISANYGFYSSVVPQQLGLQAMSFPAIDQATLYFFNPNAQLYRSALTFFDFGAGNPDTGWYDGDTLVDPAPKVGEGFLLRNPQTARTWTRSFTVN